MEFLFPYVVAIGGVVLVYGVPLALVELCELHLLNRPSPPPPKPEQPGAARTVELNVLTADERESIRLTLQNANQKARDRD